MTSSRSIFPRILDALRKARRVTVCAHVRPDGDAAGSTLALALMVARMGDAPREVCAAVDPDELGICRFLCDNWPRAECPLLPPAAAAARPCDLLVCLDTASVDRLPAPFRPLVGTVPVLVIDHHVTNPRFGSVNWVEDASATGECIARIARRARWPMDRRIAEALWVAIVTDSGRFAYDKTTPATLRAAAFLLRHGVRTAELNDRIFAQCSAQAIEVRRRAFASLEIAEGGRYASVTVTGQDFAEVGCTKSDVEDVVDIPRSLRGNLVAVFFYGTPGSPDTTHVSIRTRPPLDATEIALRHGGGGHARAAGCTVAAPIAAAKDRIGREIHDWLASQESLP